VGARIHRQRQLSALGERVAALFGSVVQRMAVHRYPPILTIEVDGAGPISKGPVKKMLCKLTTKQSRN
jgi:hypothetical protein